MPTDLNNVSTHYECRYCGVRILRWWAEIAPDPNERQPLCKECADALGYVLA